MNSIFKLITNQQIPETANALVPVIGYEPWSLRALESIKSSIVNGVPTLIRVHSAADYPIENEELSHRLDIHSTADRINDFEHNTSPQFEDLREVAGRDWTLTESLKQSVSPKISLQGSTPYLFALERASGTHNNSVQRIAVPTHPPTCCVVCPFL